MLRPLPAVSEGGFLSRVLTTAGVVLEPGPSQTMSSAQFSVAVSMSPFEKAS